MLAVPQRGTIGAVTETFTCASCHGTFEKGWSDEEAAAEAEEFFPGINVTDPAEAGMVCDGCYQHIMGRARAEAPELIGEGWRGQAPQPIPDFPGFITSLTAGGCTLNPCPAGCQDKDSEHVHLRHWDGHDGIIWADGRVSEYDLTQPARRNVLMSSAGAARVWRSSPGTPRSAPPPAMTRPARSASATR